ncbi:hypothetical protein MKX01_022352 [Papaver californicum]|nr:hypothetical protein MKX01_022352 [Papaver californicum]
MNPFYVPFATTNMGFAMLTTYLDVMLRGGSDSVIIPLGKSQNPDLRVNSTKSMIGHILGVVGVVEVVALVQAIRTGWVHTNVNLENPEEGVVSSLLWSKIMLSFMTLFWSDCMVPFELKAYFRTWFSYAFYYAVCVSHF